MVEAVRASKREPVSLIDRAMVGTVVDYVLPGFVALLVILSLAMTLGRVSTLRTWSADYDGAGDFLVESCVAKPAFGGGQWLCGGRLVSEGTTQELRTTLASPIEARGADRPYVGQRLEIFHADGDRSVVYPLAYRLNEMTRVYLSLIPRLLLFIGSLMWIVGWFLTRNADRDDLVARDAMRLPQRFGWQTRALSWFAAAGAFWVLNHLVTTRVIGSLDIL